MIQAVALANISTWLVLLSMLPIVVLFIAYRGYNNQRRKHETIEVLYQATMALHESPNIDAGLVTVLDHASRALRGEFAQLVLFTPDGSAVTSVSGPGDSRRSMTSVPPSVAMVTRRLLAALTGATRLDPSDPAQATFLEAIGARNGVAAPLTTDSERSGLLVVGNRLGSLGTFDIGDVKLMSLLANQVNVALERGWLERSLSQLIELEKQLKHQAYHDPLTGLANRSLFGERVSAALVAKVGADHAVLLIDLDDFKTVNDSLGHAAGDELLTIVAARISGSLRPTDLTARIGGDEFAVLLENIGGLNAATDTAQRIIDALRAPIRLYTQEVVVRASIGIAMTNAGREELGEVLRNADMALYHAKSLGKGQHAVYEARMHQQASERLELTAALAQAVERHEFALRYQPIHDLMSGDVIGVETLVRWLHPMRGEVRPDQFVTLAEETGLIVPMGAWVLEESCLQLARWTQEFRDRPRFSTAVNMSARQLQHPGFVEHVRRVLLDTKIEPSRLTLELTESVLIEDSSTTLGTLAELKALGVRLAIDDFGTGFSSLNYVHRFPIDALKIDRSFVNTLGSGSADSALVSAIVQLASSLGLSAVAEGLETSKQLEELRRLGCRYGQGYLFSAPMEADEIGRLLRRSVPTVPFLSRN
jgi:diguanylate cyclase (GGDEF)-like protein